MICGQTRVPGVSVSQVARRYDVNANLVFAWVRDPRFSTLGQSVDAQLCEVKAAGFSLPDYRIVSETVSGSVSARQRPEFRRLVDRLEPGDILVVTKLDRLGRDAMDVAATVDDLAKIPVRVYCLALGGVDLSSPSGQLTMNVLNAVAQFERDLLRERTHAGLEAARQKGRRLGRPRALTPEREAEAREALQNGEAVASIARRLQVSRATITRLR